MVRRAYTGMIHVRQKMDAARSLHRDLALWRNDLRPFSPEYGAVCEALKSLEAMAQRLTGEPLFPPTPWHSTPPRRPPDS
jgi:hypothetical protein